MKKILSIILSAIMVAAMFTAIPFGASAAWDGTTATAFTGSGTNADPFIIASAENLAYLQQQVALGEDYAGMYFTQTADIDLGGNEWTPIGTSDVYFSGVYDGLNHSINGLSITKGDINCTGLFGYITSSYKHETGIMNLKLYGEINIADLTKDNGIGALCGWVYKDSTDGFLTPKIYNIENHVNITINANAKQPRLGAVLGYAFTAEVINVVNYGSITYQGDGNTRVGGIVGQTNRTLYKNCVNNADISVTVGSNVSAQAAGMGGMITWKEAGKYTEFDHCVNNGKITCVSNDGGCYAGGIVAAIYTPDAYLQMKITNCINNGAISSTMQGSIDGKYAYAGGIIPRINISQTEVSNCVNTSLEITSVGATGDLAAGICSDITKEDPETIIVKDCVTGTLVYVAKSLFEVPAGKFAATEAELNAAVDPIMKAIPDVYADAKIDGFPGAAEQPTEAPTQPQDQPTEAPTQPEDQPTEAPTQAEDQPTEAPTQPQEQPTEAPKDDKGCGSAVACGLALVALLGCAYVSRKHN